MDEDIKTNAIPNEELTSSTFRERLDAEDNKFMSPMDGVQFYGDPRENLNPSRRLESDLDMGYEGVTKSELQSDFEKEHGLTGLSDEQINEFNAQNQGFFETTGKGVGRFATSVIGNTLKMVTDLGGLAVEAIDSMAGQAAESFFDIDTGSEERNAIYNNIASDLIDKGMNYINETAFHLDIPKSVQDGDIWDAIGSPAVWATEGADAFGNLISYMVPGVAIKALGLGARAASSVANVAGKLAKGGKLSPLSSLSSAIEAGAKLTDAEIKAAKTLLNIEKAVDYGAMNVVNTMFESVAEGRGAATNVYDKLIAQGYSETDARKIANDRGKAVTNANIPILMASNLIELPMLFGKAKTSSGMLGDVMKAPKQSFMKNLWNASKSIGPRSIGDVAWAGVWEGAWEEGLQFAAEQYYSNLDPETLISDGKLDFIDDQVAGILKTYGENFSTNVDMQKGMVFGALMGGGMGVMSNIREYNEARGIVDGRSGKRSKVANFINKTTSGMLMPDKGSSQGIRQFLEGKDERTQDKIIADYLNEQLKSGLSTSSMSLLDIIEHDEQGNLKLDPKNGLKFKIDEEKASKITADLGRQVALAQAELDAYRGKDDMLVKHIQNQQRYDLMKPFLVSKEAMALFKETKLDEYARQQLAAENAIKNPENNGAKSKVIEEKVNERKKELSDQMDRFKVIHDTVANAHHLQTIKPDKNNKEIYNTFNSELLDVKLGTQLTIDNAINELKNNNELLNERLKNTEVKSKSLVKDANGFYPPLGSIIKVGDRYHKVTDEVLKAVKKESPESLESISIEDNAVKDQVLNLLEQQDQLSGVIKEANSKYKDFTNKIWLKKAYNQRVKFIKNKAKISDYRSRVASNVRYKDKDGNIFKLKFNPSTKGYDLYSPKLDENNAVKGWNDKVIQDINLDNYEDKLKDLELIEDTKSDNIKDNPTNLGNATVDELTKSTNENVPDPIKVTEEEVLQLAKTLNDPNGEFTTPEKEKYSNNKEVIDAKAKELKNASTIKDSTNDKVDETSNKEPPSNLDASAFGDMLGDKVNDDVEVKKADIENRRKEEASKYKDYNESFESYLSPESKKKLLNEVNAKYDAELAALESSKEPKSNTTSSTKVPVDPSLPSESAMVSDSSPIDRDGNTESTFDIKDITLKTPLEDRNSRTDIANRTYKDELNNDPNQRNIAEFTYNNDVTKFQLKLVRAKDIKNSKDYYNQWTNDYYLSLKNNSRGAVITLDKVRKLFPYNEVIYTVMTNLDNEYVDINGNRLNNQELAFIEGSEPQFIFTSLSGTNPRNIFGDYKFAEPNLNERYPNAKDVEEQLDLWKQDIVDEFNEWSKIRKQLIEDLDNGQDTFLQIKGKSAGILFKRKDGEGNFIAPGPLLDNLESNTTENDLDIIVAVSDSTSINRTEVKTTPGLPYINNTKTKNLIPTEVKKASDVVVAGKKLPTIINDLLKYYIDNKLKGESKKVAEQLRDKNGKAFTNAYNKNLPVSVFEVLSNLVYYTGNNKDGNVINKNNATKIHFHPTKDNVLMLGEFELPLVKDGKYNPEALQDITNHLNLIKPQISKVKLDNKGETLAIPTFSNGSVSKMNEIDYKHYVLSSLLLTPLTKESKITVKNNDFFGGNEVQAIDRVVGNQYIIYDKPKLRNDEDVDLYNEESKTVGIPLFITKDMRQQLLDLKYSREDIKEMTAQDANDIIKAGTTKVTEYTTKTEEVAKEKDLTDQDLENEDSELDSLFDNDEDPDIYNPRLYRPYSKLENIEKFKTWFEDKFPNSISVNELTGLINKGLFGYFKDNAIYLDKEAEVGTGYHESFHVVSQLFLSKKEQSNLYKEWKDNNSNKELVTYDDETKLGKEFTPRQIEEALAEDFRDFMLSNGKLKFSNKVKDNFFKRLWNFLRNILTNRKSIDDIFNKIETGQYKNVEYSKRITDTFTSTRKFDIVTKDGVSDSSRNSPKFEQEAMEAVDYYFFDTIRKEYGNFDMFFNKVEEPGFVTNLYSKVKGELNKAKQVYINKINTYKPDYNQFLQDEKDGKEITIKEIEEIVSKINNNDTTKSRNDLNTIKRYARISGDNFDSTKLRNAVKSLFRSKLKNPNKYIADIEAVLTQFDNGVIEAIHKDNLKSRYSLAIQDEASINESTDETERGKSFDSDKRTVQYNAKVNASKQINLILKTLPDLYRDSSGNYKVKLNGLGLPKVVNYSKTFVVLLNEMNTVKSFPELFEVLNKLKVKLPAIHHLYNDKILALGRLLNDADKFNSDELPKYEDFPIDKFFDSTALIQTFAKTDLDFMIDLANKGGNSVTLNSVNELKRQTVSKEWSSNANADAKASANKGFKDTIYDSEHNYNKDYFIKKYPGGLKNNDLRLEFFNDLGIEFSERNKILGMASKGIPNSEITKANNEFIDLFEKRKIEAVSSYLFNRILKDEKFNIWRGSDESGISHFLQRLTDFEYESNIEKYENSHRGLSGETEYNKSLHNNISRVMDDINKAKTLTELYELLPHLNPVEEKFLKNSLLLKPGGHLFDNNGTKRSGVDFATIIHSGIQEQESGEVVEYQDLSDTDRFRTVINQFIGNKKKGTQATNRFYNMIRTADKKLERYFKMNGNLLMTDNNYISNYKGYLADELASMIQSQLEDSKFNNFLKKDKNTKQSYYEGIMLDLVRASLDANGHNQDVFIKDFLFQDWKTILENSKDSIETYVQNFINVLNDNELEGTHGSLDNAIESYFDNYTDDIIDALVDNNVLKPLSYFNKATGKTSYGYEVKGLHVNVNDKGNISKEDLIKELKTFAINDYAMNIEQFKLIFGNPAYYKDVDSIFKRTGSFPGTTKLMLDDKFINKYIKANFKRVDKSTNTDVSISDEYRGFATERSWIVNDPKSSNPVLKYFGMEESDGFSLITMDAWREMLLRTADWDSNLEALYQHEMQNYYGDAIKDKDIDFTKEDFKKTFNFEWEGIVRDPRTLEEIAKPSEDLVINMLKPLYTGPYANEKGFKPGMYKTAFGVMSPSMLKGLRKDGNKTNMEKTMDLMRKKQVGILSFASANKGITTKLNNGQITDLYTDKGELNSEAISNAPTQDLYYKYLGIQLDTGNKTHHTVIYGTQMMKQITNALHDKGVVKPEFEGLINDYDRYNNERIRLGKKILLKKLGINKDDNGEYILKDVSFLKKTLTQEAISRDLNENIIDQINLLDEDFGVDALSNRKKFEQIIFAMVDSKVIKQKRKGTAAYQHASSLMEVGARTVYEDGTLSASDLKFYTNENGKVNSMEVYLPDIYKGKVKIEYDENGRVKPNKLLQLIGFRIPTQGLSSIESIVIKGFLPASSGDIIVMPSEIVAKAGSDYDIDKLPIFFPNTYIGANKKPEYMELGGYAQYVANMNINGTKIMSEDEYNLKANENALTEVQNSIITHPSNFNTLTKALDSKLLPDLADEIHELYFPGTPRKGGNYRDVANRLFLNGIAKRMSAGKAMVGITALASTFHIMAQKNNIYIEDYYADYSGSKGMKAFPTRINMPHNKTTDGKISLGGLVNANNDEIDLPYLFNLWISAAVDAAKDPFTFDMNINTQNLNVALYLSMTGTPIEDIIYFMNQPIIRDYMKNQARAESVLAEVTDTKLYRNEIIRETLRQYGVPIPGFTNKQGEFIEAKALDQLLNMDNETIYTKEGKNGTRSLKKMIENRANYSSIDAQNILSDFIRYQDMAKKLSRAIQGATFDTNGAGKNVGELYARLAQTRLTEIDNIQNYEIKDNKGKVIKVIGQGPTIANYKNIYNPEDSKTPGFLKPYYREIEALKGQFSPIFHIMKDSEYIKSLEFVVNKYLNKESTIKKADLEEIVGKLPGSYIDYQLLKNPYSITSTTDKSSKNYTGQLDVDYLGLVTGDNTVAMQLSDLSMDKRFKNNTVIQSLMPIFRDSEYTEKDHIVLTNQKMDKIEADTFTRDWERLINNEETRDFAINLMLVSLGQYGMGLNPNTYSHLIPGQLYKDMFTSTKKNYDMLDEVSKKEMSNDHSTRFPLANFRNKVLVPKHKSYAVKLDFSQAPKYDPAFKAKYSKELKELSTEDLKDFLADKRSKGVKVYSSIPNLMYSGKTATYSKGFIADNIAGRNEHEFVGNPVRDKKTNVIIPGFRNTVDGETFLYSKAESKKFVDENVIENENPFKEDPNNNTMKHSIDNGFKYFGANYSIEVKDGKAIDVIDYKGKNINKQKILDAYNSNPNVDIQNGKAFRDSNKNITNDSKTNAHSTIFSKEQISAINKASEFIDKGNPNEYYVIEGKAGTGKTTIAEQIARKYPKSNIEVAALSNKAKKVIEDKFSEKGIKAGFNSIAGLLGLVLDQETGQFVENKDPRAPVPPIKYADIIMIDEASMVNEDIIDKIFTMKPRKSKVIFLGDIGQLPPIRTLDNPYYKNKSELLEKKSPVFESKNKSLLTTRFRQGELSPILPYADYFWENSQIESPEVNPVKGEKKNVINDNGALIFTDSIQSIKDDVVSNFKKAVELKQPNLIKVITYRNATRKSINKAIHNNVFGSNSPEFNKGEILIFNDNYGNFENSQEVQIEEVSDIFIDGGTGLRIVEIKVPIDENNYDTFKVVIEEDKAKYNKLVSDLFTRAKNTTSKSEKRMLFSDAWELKNKFADIDYAYAITSHKSQGSQYDIVVIDEADIMNVKPIGNKTKSESIYTALTRAKNISVVITNSKIENDRDLNLTDINNNINNSKQSKPKSTESNNVNSKTTKSISSKNEVDINKKLSEFINEEDEQGQDASRYVSPLQKDLDYYYENMPNTMLTKNKFDPLSSQISKVKAFNAHNSNLKKMQSEFLTLLNKRVEEIKNYNTESNSISQESLDVINANLAKAGYKGSYTMEKYNALPKDKQDKLKECYS